MRVYLPATIPMLRQLAETGVLAVPLSAHAVTPALREWYTEGNVEELEYAAMVEAAEASLRLLHDDSSAPPRRVVVAGEVDVALAAPPGHEGPRSLVLLPGALERRQVASLHVDDPEAAGDVSAAVAAVEAAAAGDENAQFTVDSAEGNDLLWYDVSELEIVLELGL